MTALHGDLLLSVAGRMETIQVFQQAPVVGGGYGPKSDPIPYRVIKRDEISSIKNQDGTIFKSASRTIWSRDQIADAAFFEEESIIWRIITDQAWKRQSGFYIYGIEKVVGLNGMPTQEALVSLGGRDF